jgi:hypothetical protein
MVTARRQSDPLLVAAYLTLVCIVVAPVFLVATPPLVDYPMHLARMWILRHAAEDPTLAANYVVHWRLVPYLAMDLAVPVMALVMPVALAGKLFLAATMALPIGGTAALHRALFGRVGWWPLASILFVYNAVLFFGFLNCLFGIGIFLFAFAGWIASAAWRPAWRIPVFALIAALLFTLHLFAFGLYGLAVASWELGLAATGRSARRDQVATLLLAALQFVPALLLWVAVVTVSAGGSDYARYGSLNDKLFALFAATSFADPPTAFDLVFWLVAAAALAAGLLQGQLRIAPRMKPVLAALLIAAAAMPNWLGGSWGADFRLPAILPFLAIAAIEARPSPRPLAAVAGVLAAALLALRLWGVVGLWQDSDRRIAEFRAADEVMTPGARLLPVFGAMPAEAQALRGIPPWLARRQEYDLTHLDAYAVIDRAAFVPDIFIAWMTVDAAPRHAGQHQIAGTPVEPDLLRRSADPSSARTLAAGPDIFGDMPFWRDWPQRFDYVLWIDYGIAPTDLPAMLKPIAHGSYFHLYRIEHG